MKQHHDAYAYSQKDDSRLIAVNKWSVENCADAGSYSILHADRSMVSPSSFTNYWNTVMVFGLRNFFLFDMPGRIGKILAERWFNLYNTHADRSLFYHESCNYRNRLCGAYHRHMFC